MFLNISEKRPNATKKASTKPSKKQKSNPTAGTSSNALKESNLPNIQQQEEILAFERERNRILKERISLKKELLELEEN